MEKSILVVDDDERVRALVSGVLRHQGFDVMGAGDGARALERFAQQKVDLVVLDLGLGSLDGLEVCRRIRESSDVPILVFTARGDEEDELLAFASGADDFVTKPCPPRVLVARVECLLRRAAVHAAEHPEAVTNPSFGGLAIDTQLRTATINGRDVHLTRIEFDLLATLMANPDRVVSRATLLSSVWGPWHGDDHLVEVHLSRLRSKIHKVGGPRVGDPVPGVGYRLGRLPRTAPAV